MVGKNPPRQSFAELVFKKFLFIKSKKSSFNLFVNSKRTNFEILHDFLIFINFSFNQTKILKIFAQMFRFYFLLGIFALVSFADELDEQISKFAFKTSKMYLYNAFLINKFFHGLKKIKVQIHMKKVELWIKFNFMLLC